MLILILGSKSGFRDDFGQQHKNHYFTPILGEHFLGQVPLSIVIATPKVPGN